MKKSQEKLLEELKSNTSYTIDQQLENDQVAVWLTSHGKSWSLCFQNGDMNGNDMGTGVWNNSGADSGLEEIVDILKVLPQYKPLIDEDTYWKYEELKEVRDKFIADLSEKENIDSFFRNKQELIDQQIDDLAEGFVSEFEDKKPSQEWIEHVYCELDSPLKTEISYSEFEAAFLVKVCDLQG